jgi:hypothetical protein
MRTLIITGALFICAAIMHAQTEQKNSTTVHIKKIENINGVEKVTDTTYSVSDPAGISTLKKPGVSESCTGDGKKQRVVIVTDEAGKDGDAAVEINMSDVMKEVEKALQEAGIDSKNLEMTSEVTATSSDNGKEKKSVRVLIVRDVKITEPTAADTKLLGKTTGVSDGKLELGKMDFYPNPSSGKFNLNFHLESKGTTAVTILNSEGKSIFNEQLKDFSGAYNKEIDISQQPKGVYFVKVEQGAHAQLKKIVLE